MDDILLDLRELWGLTAEERKTLFRYIQQEQGGGLILTHASLSDLRIAKIKGEEKEITAVSPYGHVDRLYLEESKSPKKILERVRGSLAAATGLGFLPLYEEAREVIAGKMGEPVIQAIIYSFPFLIPGIPYSGNFKAIQSDDPILNGLGNTFSVTPKSTVIGWQLEYPEELGNRAIKEGCKVSSKAKEYLKEVLEVQKKGVEKHGITIPEMEFTSLEKATDRACRELSLYSEQFKEQVASALKQACELVKTQVPDKIEIPLKWPADVISGVDIPFSIPAADISAEKVPVIELVCRAERVAESDDGLAAILRFEVGNHRAVYFSFKPSEGGDECDTCLTLMRNAILWSARK